MPQKKKLNKETTGRNPLSQVSFKEYQLITLDENHILKVKNGNLIQRVLNTSRLIKDAEIALQRKNIADRELAEWRAYLACDNIPKPFQPEEVRKFFIKTRHFEKEDTELTVNWLLAVDERSILNQDIDSPNFTYRYLKETKIDFGAQYDARVNEALEVLRRIQDFLEKPTVQLTKRIVDDVIEAKFLAFKEINHHIDNLTYRVLSSEEAYMNTIDVTTAEYSYGATNFDIHLWTFKNVPIYLDPIDTPHIAIDLAKIKINLVIPFSVLCENLVIRGLHCYFDHFSAHTRYSELSSVIEDEQDLTSCLRKEWDTQQKIQAEVREMLIKQRADFDEEMRLKAEEEELKAKLRKQQEQQSKGLPPKKPEKPKKQFREPQTVTPDVVPSIRSDFFQYDNACHEDIMKSLHPDMLALSNGEVNLRKFQILGGVYQLNSLSKPNIANLPKLIMAWYKISQQIDCQDLRNQLEKPNSSDTTISKFFQITFELPEHFCRWGEPIPCLFEEGESYRSEEADCCETAKTLNISSPVIINDFNLHQLFTKPLMYTFIENCIPRILSSFKFPEDLVDEEDDKKANAALGRAKLTATEQQKEDELTKQKQLLSFDVQKSPERLFPVFKKVFPVVILPIQEERREKKSHAYEYFSDFLSALEVIKESYQATTFKDKHGKPIKIIAEIYDRNIRKQRSSLSGNKFLVIDKTEGRKCSSGSLSENVQGMGKSGSDGNARIEVATKAKKTEKKTAADNKTNTKDRESDFIKEKEFDDQKEFSKWSTTNILKSEFNAKDKKITIWTDRLGIFGFAFYRYQHFPFQTWSLQPNKENSEEIELTIESMFAVFRIYITPNGYKASITDFAKFYKSRRAYLEISEPITEIKILKEKLQQKFLNIFPEPDAAWYMTGYFSEKHRSAEYHTYNCMSLYTTRLKFSNSIWNKLSNRRTMVLKFGELRDLEKDMLELRISPEDVMFVEVQEVCTDLETVELQYKPTWRNLEWYPDLNHLIISTFNDAEDMRLKNPNTISYLKNLLQAIRPLSCS